MARAPPLLPLLPLLLLLLLLLLAAGSALDHQIVNFNFQTVQVTWAPGPTPGANLTFLYRFEHKNETECPSYLVLHGLRAGCVLPAEGDAILSFSVLNGTQSLLSRSLWISSYLKPSAPRDLRVLWRPEAVTVACADLPFRGLQYEVQHKSSFDSEWDSQVSGTCNVTIGGLDADKCYAFRARVTTEEAYYDPTTYPSDWSEVAHLQGGQRRESCLEGGRAGSTFLPIYILAALLTVLLLLLCVWRLRRVKRLLMPSVPDPKASFPGLFEAHHGNFQEWIRDTQNLSRLQKEEEEQEEEEGESDPVLIAGLEVQPPKAGAPETETGPPCAPSAQTGAGGTPGRTPQGDEVLALGGFKFTMGDNAYVML